MSRSAWRRGKRRRVAVLARSEMHCTGSREACMGQVHKPSVGLTVGRAAPPRLLCSLVEVPNGLGADGLAALNRLGELAMTPGHRPEAPTSDALDNELGAAICRVGCVPPVTRRPLVVRTVGAAFVWSWCVPISQKSWSGIGIWAIWSPFGSRSLGRRTLILLGLASSGLCFQWTGVSARSIPKRMLNAVDLLSFVR